MESGGLPKLKTIRPVPTSKLEIDFNSKEPWSDDTILIVPFLEKQILMNEYASVLGVETFLKMTHLKYEIKEFRNAADMSTIGKVPVLACGPYIVAELEGIVQLADTKGVCLSEHLSTTEKADLRAYMSLIHSVLEKAIQYFVWLDDTIYRQYTWGRVGSVHNFFGQFIIPWVYRQKYRQILSRHKWSSKTPEQVYREVEICLLTISERLGDTDYFFGNNPTELDALTFGYLFTMLTTRLHPEDRFRELVLAHKNLVNLCQRVETQFFKTVTLP